MTTANQSSILVVDDDPDICRNLSDILTDLGYHVDTATGGRAALELVRQHSYEVALLDLKMPDMDGLTLYREIKKLQADTVAIVVSAYASGAVTDEALTAGAWQVLPKPVDLDRLLCLVGAAIDQPLVLVVDDDEDLCQNLWDLLHERGYRVCMAHNEEEAGERLRGKAFHIVLIDLKLPSGDGSAVFRLVRQNTPQTRTVLITGHRSEMDELIQRDQAEGADAVCYKPFDVPRLLELLQRLSRRADSEPVATP
jgi:DNA-binding NtrC family response regulator